jgi:membrane protease YdiL (CAAX protease family)
MIEVVVLVVGLPLIYLLSRALKVQSKPIAIADSKKEVILASLVTVAAFLIVFVWRTWMHTSQLDLRSAYYVDLIDISAILVLYIPALLVVAVVMKRSGQSLQSIGITGKDKGRMLALGLAISAVYVTVSGLLTPSLGGSFTGFSPTLAYGLVLFSIVGFSEEIVWRGYVQTRLTAYSGKLTGLVVTSLLFAVLWHFPVAYYVETSGVVLEALAYAIMRVVPGLLFGYLMSKSQNIIPSSIFHLFWNWNTLLWQISL